MYGENHNPGGRHKYVLLACYFHVWPQKVKLRLISIKHLNIVVLLHTLHCHINLSEQRFLKQTMQREMNKSMSATMTKDSSQDIRLTGSQGCRAHDKKRIDRCSKNKRSLFWRWKRGSVRQYASVRGVLARLRRGNEFEHSSVFHAWIMFLLTIYVLNILFNFCLQWQLILQYE